MKLIKHLVASTFLLSNVVFGLVPENTMSQGSSGPLRVVPNQIISCPTEQDVSIPEFARRIAHGNARFALNLYRAANDSNVAISPFSASSCMAMIAMVAEGETLKQIQQVLSFPESSSELDFGFRWINESLTSGMAIGSEPVHFTPSNTIWTQKGAPVFPILLTKMLHFWDGIQETDFMNAPDESRQLINLYVEDKTRGIIKDFLPNGSITESTRMVAVNTIYLKAPWKKSFKEYDSRDDIFYGINGEKIHSFMRKTDHLNVADLDTCTLIEVPFADSLSTESKISLVVLLPNEDVLMSDVESSLNARLIRETLQTIKPKAVNFTFPVFSTESTMSMKPTLIKMGLSLPFETKGGFSLSSDGPKMVLSDVIQTVKVDFNEWGATCAAATGAIMCLTSHVDFTDAVDITVNRPFIYLVVDKTTQSILFMGKVSTL